MFLRSQIFLSRLNVIFHLKIVICSIDHTTQLQFPFLCSINSFRNCVVKGTSTHSGNLKMCAEQKSNRLEMVVRNNPNLKFIMFPEWFLFFFNFSLPSPKLMYFIVLRVIFYVVCCPLGVLM